MGKLLLFLLGRYRHYPKRTTGIMAATLASLTYTIVFSFSFKFIIDDVIARRDGRLLAAAIIGLAAGFVVYLWSEWAKDRWMVRLGTDMRDDLRFALFAQLQKLPLSFYQHVGRGSITSRFTNDLSAVGAAFMNIQPTAAAMLGLVLNTATSCLVNWKLTLLSMLGLALAFLLPSWVHRHAAKANDELKSRQTVLLELIEEQVSVDLVVRAYGLNDWQNGRLRDAADAIKPLAVRADRLNRLSVSSVAAALLFLNLLIVALGAFWVMAGNMTIGELVSFQSIFLGMSQQASRLAQYLPQFFVAETSFDRIDKLLRETPGEAEMPTMAESGAAELRRDIRFRDVSFAYAGHHDVLHHVDIDIAAKTHIAFVGASGAGKSTVVQLLMKFYAPDRGQVEVDGVDLRHISSDSLRRMIGYVPQEPVLFRLSLSDNIRLGKRDAGDEEIEAAARAAGIHDWIDGLADRYRTSCGENGRALSVGQRQKVAIARALIRQPSVLILDEATSALDPESEAAVEHAVRQFAGAKTIVSVTHRLKSAMQADRIFVMDGGRLVGSGTHEELLAGNELYRRMWRKQAGFAVSGDGRTAHIAPHRLADIPLFAGLDEKFLESVRGLLITEYAEAGQTIVRQGEEGDTFYIIVRGRVGVWKRSPDAPEESRLAVLEDGDHFGEIALMLPLPRTATIRALTPCTLLAMHRELFQNVLNRADRSLRDRLERTCRERLQSG